MAPKKARTASRSLLRMLSLLGASAWLSFVNGFVLKSINGSAPPKQQVESLALPIFHDKKGLILTAAVAGFSVSSLLLATSMAFLPLPASAIVSGGENFAGSYSDPKHPNCKRIIEVVASNGEKKVLLSGADGTPACPADGSGKEWALQGRIDGGGTKILVDFSPKGGPSDIAGNFFQGKDSSGINWPDGNTWTKK
jgi:hypothetical protein